MFEIGNSLREARLRQQLDFPDIERVTKIRPKYLRALEDENFEQLPAQTYVKGFLRTYAEFLGLDGQLYVDEYNSRYVTREDDLPFRPRRSTSGRRGRGFESSVVLGALVGIAVVFGLVIAAWKSGDHPAVQQTTTEALRPVVTPELVIRPLRATRLEVRRGRNENGTEIFLGTLDRVQRFAVTGPLWIRIAEPRAVRIDVAGHREQLPQGTNSFVVTRGGVTPAR